MLISARTHYATVAMLELALRVDEPTPVTIREIAGRHAIPAPFLTQILRELRGAGWVRSQRGAQGGYRLAVEPTEISLLEIVDAVGGSDSVCQLESGSNVLGHTIGVAWDEASQAARDKLASRTLDDLVRESRTIESHERSPEAAMFYI